MSMNIARTLFISVFLLFFLVSCAAKKSNKSMVVVLLPGPDGKTGQIVVSNAGGSILVSEPEQAIEIHSATLPPSQPFAMKAEKIREDFGEALSALPSPPIHFILYFHTGTTIITEESRKLLEKILPEIASRRTIEVSVVGHTDTEGSRKMNQQLGMERAMEMRNLLVSQGIDPRIIEVTSHGEGNLLVKTPDQVPEPRNRRVEVILR
jgi:outer membrane protein OmpA-like peptidoglycan-associated protein